jgi:hypothetical protein
MIKRLKNFSKSMFMLALFMVIVSILLPVLVPLVLFQKLTTSFRLWVFRRREAGNYYLICTSRRNWYDFLKNNVIPVLPPNVRVVWQKSDLCGPKQSLSQYLRKSRITGLSKPYLVAVTRRSLVAQSLNTIFQNLKQNAKRTETSRIQCRRIIEEKQQSLCSNITTVR